MVEKVKSTNPSTQLVFGLLFVLTFLVILMLIAGDWRWLEGWNFSLWFIAMAYTAVIYLYVKDPSLLVERTQSANTPNQPV